MSKYIDADKAIKEIIAERDDGSLDGEYKDGFIDGMSTAAKILDEWSAADVQEVRHGRWVDMWFCSNYSGYDYGMNCSVCGKPMHRQLAEKMPPFCPNCGSRMDLEGDAE